MTFKKGCISWNKGRTLTNDHKKRVSESMIKKIQEGYKPKSIFKKGHTLNNGRKLSEDHKNKIAKSSIFQKGHHLFIGRKVTDEERNLNSKIRKELWNNLNYNHPFKRPEVLEKLKLARIKRKQEGRYISTEQSRYKNKIAQIELMKNPENRDLRRQARLKQVFPTKDSSIEVKLQQKLRENNIKFITHKMVLGQPDIFIEPNICIFADGNYWHNLPNAQEKDKKVTEELQKQGYMVLRFWEHEINNNPDECINKIKGICVPLDINNIKKSEEDFKKAITKVWNNQNAI